MAEPQGRPRPQNRTSPPTQIAGATIILFIVDLLFVLTEVPVWTSNDPNNQVWQTIRPLHGFGIFCFVLINIFKLILLVITLRGASQANQNVLN